MIRRFLIDTSGSSAVDYALIATLISIVIIAATVGVGAKLNAKFFGPVVGGFN